MVNRGGGVARVFQKFAVGLDVNSRSKFFGDEVFEGGHGGDFSRHFHAADGDPAVVFGGEVVGLQ